jgi:hypothetical protein
MKTTTEVENREDEYRDRIQRIYREDTQREWIEGKNVRGEHNRRTEVVNTEVSIQMVSREGESKG